MRVKTTLCGAVAILVMTGLVVSAPPAIRGKAPVKDPVARALAYAPKGTIGVVHVNVNAVGRDVVKKLVRAGAGAEVIGHGDVKVLLTVLGKIESADVYVTGRDGRPSLIVLRGPITAEDLVAVSKVFHNSPFKKQSNGRYGAGGKGDPRVVAILGAEATDLPARVSLIGWADMLRPAFFKTLGRQNNDKLVGLLKGVDTSADVWGAMDTSAAKGDNAPGTVKGSLSFAAKGRSKVEALFDSAEAARKAATEVGDSPLVRRSRPKSITIKAEGARLTIALNSWMTAMVLSKLVAGLVREEEIALASAWTLARRAGSMANLEGLGKAIMSYGIDQIQDPWPPDLEMLIKMQQPPGLLVSPGSGRKSPYDAKGKFRSDYIYIKGMPNSGPGYLVTVYEPPELNNFERVLVLDFNGSVSVLKPLEFKRQIERTEEWFKKKGKTFTMDPKTREWLKTVGEGATKKTN